MNRLFLSSVLFLGVALASAGETEPSKIVAAVKPFVDRHELSGAVMLVATRDKVLELQTIGCADIAAKKPMRPDSLFWIASQSKPIAASCLMMLVDEGKVSLDDPVEKYLPEFRDQWLVAERDKEHLLLKKPKNPILVRNLLSHTSGMLYKTPVEQPTLDLVPQEARMHLYVMSPLQFEPGTKQLYANAGINTAARIVELLSGMPYERFVQERVFNPLGMTDTTFWPTKRQLARLAKSYKPKAGMLEEAPIPQLRYPLDDRTRCVQPAGGLFSTAHDLLNFYRMVLNGGEFEGRRILSAKSLELMTTKQTGDLPQKYGFGFDLAKGGIGHGGTHGTRSRIDPSRRLISIIMIQSAGPSVLINKIHRTFDEAVQAAWPEN